MASGNQSKQKPKAAKTDFSKSSKPAAKTGINKRSGLPKGSAVAYVKGQHCGRGKHNYVTAKSGTYAVCTKCHSRRSFSKE